MKQNTIQYVILCIFILSGPYIFAQNDETGEKPASVEKSLFGVQTGFLGVWGHHEARLSNRIALRSEMGLNGGFWWGSRNNNGYILTPVLSLEPRWYYNINKRHQKSKNIENNSANYVSVNTFYHPDWFNISNDEHVSVIPSIYIVPTWGIRRSVGNQFHFEMAAGIGYRYEFRKSVGFAENSSGGVLTLRLAFGYTF